MKNIIKYICTALILLSVAGCNPYETYPDGRPDLEHVYYVSNVKTGSGLNFDLQYEFIADGPSRFLNRLHTNPSPPVLQEWVYSEDRKVTMPVRLRFISERVRSYDVVTYHWIESRTGDLKDGIDYEVLAENGTRLTLTNGAFSLTWPQAKKAEQSIKIRRLSSALGELRVQTLERAKQTFPTATLPEDIDRNAIEQHINNQTSEYTVKGLWHDYKYPVIIRFINPITVTANGLGSLKVGQAVSGASIVYTLNDAYSYATGVTAADFAVSGLPDGLTAAAATRTSATVVTVAITGTPATLTTATTTITRPSTIPQTNVPNASSALAVSGTLTASIVAKGDGAAVSVPTVNGTPTQTSITVNAVTMTPATTGQLAEYAITETTTAPTGGWQLSETFNGLTAGTSYYVWARSASNANYNAGTAQRSVVINTEP